MLLSWFFLKTRYKLVHFVAVTVCLLGVGAMVGADILAERDQGSSKEVFLLLLCECVFFYWCLTWNLSCFSSLCSQRRAAGRHAGPAQRRALRRVQRVPGAHGEEPESGGVPGHDGAVWDPHQRGAAVGSGLNPASGLRLVVLFHPCLFFVFFSSEPFWKLTRSQPWSGTSPTVSQK